MNSTTVLFGRSNPHRSLLAGVFSSSTTHKPKPSARPVAATGKKILLVDDDAIILKTTSMKLQSHGYAVVTATDGPSAIQAVRTEKPHLILLDLNFPADAGGGAVSWDGLLIVSWLRRVGALD